MAALENVRLALEDASMNEQAMEVAGVMAVADVVFHKIQRCQCDRDADTLEVTRPPNLG
jgi:hypothetical protein